MAINNTIIEWLNENELRAYPLTADSNRYFKKGINTFDIYPIVLDALLSYPTLPNIIQISQLRTTSTNLIITVTGTSFTITNYQSITYPQYVRDTNYNLLVVGEYVKSLPINTTFNLTNIIFEPSVLLEIFPNNLGITGITIGDDIASGDITFNEGYQVSLVPGENISIEVGRNRGIVLPCSDILGINSNTCDSVISSINGITPNKTGENIKFVGKNHVNIYDDPDNNRIYIGYDFVQDDVPIQKLPNPNIIV